jgi:hypothetical protein
VRHDAMRCDAMSCNVMLCNAVRDWGRGGGRCDGMKEIKGLGDTVSLRYGTVRYGCLERTELNGTRRWERWGYDIHIICRVTIPRISDTYV